MAYIKFSTRKANYTLQLMNHGGVDDSGTTPELFENIDGLVLENPSQSLDSLIKVHEAGDDYDIITIDDEPTMDYRPIIRQAKQGRIPIYSVDVPLLKTMRDGKYRLTKKQLFEMLPEALTCLPFMKSFSQTEELPYSARVLIPLASFLSQSPFAEGRNAINAAKIENVVVERVKNYSGKERPNIGLVYGAGHVGLEPNLKSPFRRNITLFNWKYLSFDKNNKFNSGQFNKVSEASYDQDNQRWDIRELDASQF